MASYRCFSAVATFYLLLLLPGCCFSATLTPSDASFVTRPLRRSLGGSSPKLDASQQKVLAQLATAWNFGSTSTWLQAGKPCASYRAITCDNKGFIISMVVPSLDISDNLELLAQLPTLLILDLNYNSITSLPSVLSSLSKLQYLDVSNNQLSDAIPSFLGSLSSLTYLDISYNAFSGLVPPSLGSLKALAYLNLGLQADGGLESPLPASLSNLANLQTLWLWSNSFNGSIPAFIGNLLKLTNLSLGGNPWEGDLPASFANLKNLVYLDVSETLLNGSFPSYISSFNKLNYLCMSTTAMYGQVPKTLVALNKLQDLDLGNAYFTGPFPDLSSIKTLTYIDLNSNYFSGVPPNFIFQAAMFDISNNYFSGYPTLKTRANKPLCFSSGTIGNCLATPPSCSDLAEDQRDPAECELTCGTGTAAGVCGKHGSCVFDNDASTWGCVCDASFKPDATAQTCTK